MRWQRTSHPAHAYAVRHGEWSVDNLVGDAHGILSTSIVSYVQYQFTRRRLQQTACTASTACHGAACRTIRLA